MKILIDLTSLADNFSGIERYAACLALELIRDPRQEYILIFKEAVHPMFAEYTSQPNVTVKVLPACHKLLFNQLRLPLAIYGMKADFYLFLAFPVPVLLFRRNMVSTMHDICCWDCPETMNHLSSIYFRVSHRIAMRKCRAILTISKFSEKRIVDRLGFDRKKLRLIYCGVDEKFLRYQRTETDKAYIQEKYHLPEDYLLSLSTLEPRKNLPLLLQAYRRLVLEDGFCVSLVLAGRKGWKMENLLEGIEPEVRQKIHFTGFIDDEDLPAVYAGAQLFVFPSMYEGFGIPPLEAMACGTRVLSSDAASLPEVLADAAVYFENNNVQALYEALKSTALSATTPAQIQNGKAQAARFDWKQQSNLLLDALQKLS